MAKSSGRAILEGQSGRASSVPQRELLGTHPAPEALLAFAEELGRLLARRELEQLKGRRAYSLPELLLGACVLAGLWMLIARMLGWFAP